MEQVLYLSRLEPQTRAAAAPSGGATNAIRDQKIG
jgi:hypothetical protein